MASEGWHPSSQTQTLEFVMLPLGWPTPFILTRQKDDTLAYVKTCAKKGSSYL